MQHRQERGKLTQLETQQQDFFNQSPDLLCIILPDGTFGQLNPAWKRLLNWTPEALRSHSWIELVHPEDMEAALSAMLQAGDGEVSFVDNRYRHNDGSYRWLSWSLHKSEDGYWYAIAREIKANRQAKIALKSQVEAIPSKTEANKWSIEKKTVMLLGLASVILVSLNLLFFWSFIKQKETTERVAQSRLILQKLEAVLSSAKDAETGQRGYLLTGRESYLQPYNLAVKTIEPQLNQLKTLARADAYQQQQLTRLQPLIEQKLAELKVTIDLKKSRGFYAAVPVVLTNEGQELMDQIRTTAQQMQKKKNEELQTWLTTREEAFLKGQVTFFIGIVLNLFAFYLVYHAIRQETIERKQAEASFKQLNDELEARVQERTAELKEANANLLRSNRELEQFAYVASHDLQEPLRAVNSYAQLITRKYQGNLDAKADKYLGYITEGATRMQQLINDLLAFSRVGTRGKPLESTDCETVLRQVLDNLKIAIAENHALVTHDPLPTVIGDEIQLIQLLQNLIGNAIKFRREEPPQVHISAKQRDNEWVFSVRDNGIGIESEYFERIFTIFQRLHSKSEYPGTGIGLAVCKKIVERHGGRIWVESTSGVGTIFYFTLLPMR
ncbi:MAG: CHASE3 domain-containing protein [Coleofasciculus sp. S288]|nr:CHASE3 domain-containing protein [Coleofasciculus sp. S288]